MPSRILVVGLPIAGPLPAAALYVGGSRHLTQLPAGAPRLAIGGDVEVVLDTIGATEGEVCVLASGDPGFFGIVRALGARFGRDLLDVRPAPSSVSLAFARIGIPWDDAAVVSAHGRPLAGAVRAVNSVDKAAVLTAPACPPELLGRALIDDGLTGARCWVCSRLGMDDESVTETDPAGLASGHWDPLSVVVIVRDGGIAPGPRAVWAGEPGVRDLGWGRPSHMFGHRAEMVTKPEVRAVVLARLELPTRGIMWDLGAGSGSVAIEVALACPEMTVIAVERGIDDARRIVENARAYRARVKVVVGDAPEILDDLSDPDRVFVGGGGLGVLDAALRRLRPNGRVVATWAAIDRAGLAADRLGHLVQLSAARGRRLPDGGWRLVGANPVFVTWGPNSTTSAAPDPADSDGADSDGADSDGADSDGADSDGAGSGPSTEVRL